jgi:hypothetical protein
LLEGERVITELEYLNTERANVIEFMKL